jgi:hypothetical protein
VANGPAASQEVIAVCVAAPDARVQQMNTRKARAGRIIFLDEDMFISFFQAVIGLYFLFFT